MIPFLIVAALAFVGLATLVYCLCRTAADSDAAIARMIEKRRNASLKAKR